MSRLWAELGTSPFLLAVIAAAAVYEAAVALGWVPLGTLPGEGPSHEGIVLAAALLAILAGCVLSWRLALRGGRSPSVALLGAAAAAFMVARFYGFDPYYLSTLRRYSDGGAVPPAWVYAVAAFALVVSLLCLRRPRTGFILNLPALLLCGLTAFFLGVGH